MNRALALPAACFLVAFAVPIAIFHRAMAAGADNENLASPPVSASSDAAPVVVARPRSGLPPANLLTLAQGHELVAALADRFLQPWRQWASSPSMMFSRIAPTPVPEANVKIVMAESVLAHDARFLLSTMTITLGTQPLVVPCVVDRATRQIWLSADGEWLSEEGWLKQAPLPNRVAKGVRPVAADQMSNDGP
jgi:hypothetical protein